MSDYLIYLFTVNIFLVFVDATIGYYAAPMLARLGGNDDETTASATRGVRTLLAAVVALYMFFNCLAFFHVKPLLLLLVTGVIVVDIVAQIVLTLKMGRRKEQ